MEQGTSRREFLRVAGGVAAGLGLASVVAIEPARATPAAMREAIAKVVGSARVTPGKVKLELPPLIENGNAVPLAVTVDSPMTEADYVRAVHIFTEKNPQPYVVSFYLGPRAGRATVATRVRLADSQTVVAICELSNGAFWSDSAEIVVTLAACLEDGI
jgi:sulfur-oxidizing protein SoxY